MSRGMHKGMRHLAAFLLLAAALGGLGHAAGATMREDYQILARALLEDGRMALRDRRLGDAKALLQQALVANPAAPQAFLLLGRLALAENDVREANRLIAIALDLAPKAQEVLLWAGKAALAGHDREQAQTHLEQLQTLCAGCDMTQELANALAAYVPPDKAAGKAPGKADAVSRP